MLLFSGEKPFTNDCNCMKRGGGKELVRYSNGGELPGDAVKSRETLRLNS